MKKVSFVLASSAFLLFGLSQAAKASDLFVVGSTFTDSGENSPDSFSTSVALASGTTSPDGGALNLTISEVFEGSDEWLVFDYQTATSGTQLVPASDDWEILQTGLNLAVPANFIGAFAEFLDSSGNAITPTSAVFPGYSVMSNPVPGGVGTGEGTFFTAAVPAGPLPALGAFIDPFDQLDATGIPSGSVEGFYQALEFAPVAAATPEPAPVVLLGVGLLGVGLMRRLKRA